MPKFAIATLGCKVNTFESEAYVQQLLQKGYTQIDFKEVADIYIINTCAVTNTAASKSKQKINQAKKNNPDAFICVVGCLIQTNAMQLEVDLLIGSQNKDRLATLIHESFHNHTQMNQVHDLNDATFEELKVTSFARQTRAFLKIQDGCNQFCSYCIIPFARGKERSLEKEKVIAQANELVNNGHKEIVLSGIHTGRYGRDLGYDLLTLLKELVNIEGLLRVRISSIEMNELTDEFLHFMKMEDKIAKHLHIPVQSCCDQTLNAMNRPYTIHQFKEKLMYIRSLIPYISISTDIILGFPNESDVQFEETKSNFADLQFSFAHVFPYSKRDGTKACEIINHLSGTIKKQRCKLISEFAKTQYELYKKQWIHQEVEVLFESMKDGYAFGHTSTYLSVYAKLDASCLNRVIKVKITHLKEGILYGI